MICHICRKEFYSPLHHVCGKDLDSDFHYVTKEEYDISRIIEKYKPLIKKIWGKIYG